MRFSLIITLCSAAICLGIAEELYSQEKKSAGITLAITNESAVSVLEAIHKETGYEFLYNENSLSKTGKITVKVRRATIQQVLQQVSNQTGLEFNKMGDTYLVSLPKAPTTPESKQQQGIHVTGTVSDNFGERVPGVSVILRGSASTGTITDANGEFSLTVPSDTSVLQFSYIGYRMQEIKVGNLKIITVTMQEDVAELGEVVVVAFGTQKKESVISAITTVNPSELKVPSSNLTTALAGKIAGVISYQRSGEPGDDDAEFFVRGVTTFGYSKSPLILLDGLEVTSSDLARLQPDDIASFSIMKDATATALYGARGANGVILVTTKEGREGKAQVSIRYETTISQPTRKIELADPITYMRLHNEAVATRDPYGIRPYSQEKMESTEIGMNPVVYPTVDWYDMLLKDRTMNHRFNMNIGGGGNIARYYLAVSYTKDNGLLKVDKRNNFNNNIDLNRYALRSNVNIKITPTTEAVVRLYGTFDDYQGPIPSGTEVYNMVMRANPVLFPAYYPAEANTNVKHIMFGNSSTGGYINPYAHLMYGYKNQTTSTMIAQFEANQKLDFILKGLKIRGLFSTTRYAQFDVARNYNPFYYTVGRYDRVTDTYVLTNLNPGSGTDYLLYREGAKIINTNTYIEAAVDYAQTFAEDHEVGALLVYYQRERLNANAGSLLLSLPFRNTGLSGRVTYGYKSKYYLEGSFGYNGSERFSKDNRFGFFPSIGLGWTVSNEEFYSDALKNIVPKIRLKATYGLVGNDAIGSDADRFFYLSEVNMDNYGRQYITGETMGYVRPGISTSRYSNPNITWETATKTNLGLELNLLSMLEINVDVYQQKQRNILLTRSNVPATMGLQVIPYTNFGEAEGRGVDFSMDANKNITTDWWLTGRVNFTYAKSKFVAYDEPDYSETPWKSRVGQSLNQTFGYVAERLFVDDNDVENSPPQAADVRGGDIKYKDINNDYIIDAFDQVPIGHPTLPEIVYGFGFSTGYKGFDLSCFFQGLARESFWIDVAATSPFVGGTNGNNALLKAYADDHWSETNRNVHALWPRLSDHVIGNNAAISTWFMQNGAFLRLKSLEAGYSLPEKLIGKIKLTKVRVYFTGTNLFSISQFKLWDPEMAGNGLGYPVQKVYNFGIQISL